MSRNVSRAYKWGMDDGVKLKFTHMLKSNICDPKPKESVRINHYLAQKWAKEVSKVLKSRIHEWPHRQLPMTFFGNNLNLYIPDFPISLGLCSETVKWLYNEEIGIKCVMRAVFAHFTAI